MEKTEFEIRDAQPADAEAIERLRYKTWLATYPNSEIGITVDDVEDRFKDRFTVDALRKKSNEIEETQKAGRFMVALSDGKIVGFCKVVRSENKNQLQGIYILPEFQGQGIGGALWGEAKKSLDLSKDTFVEVANYNCNAIGFYRKLGFVETGRSMNLATPMKSGISLPEIEMKLAASN